MGEAVAAVSSVLALGVGLFVAAMLTEATKAVIWAGVFYVMLKKLER